MLLTGNVAMDDAAITGADFAKAFLGLIAAMGDTSADICRSGIGAGYGAFLAPAFTLKRNIRKPFRASVILADHLVVLPGCCLIAAPR